MAKNEKFSNSTTFLAPNSLGDSSKSVSSSELVIAYLQNRYDLAPRPLGLTDIEKTFTLTALNDQK